MSTRAIVEFRDEHKARAAIYIHSDGYPDSQHGMIAGFHGFFDAVEAETNDTRFDDPEYLAAKYVVHKASLNARRYDFKTGEWTPSKPLDFLGVGVVAPGTDYAQDYVYRIRCDRLNEVTFRPEVRVFTPDGKEITDF